MSLSEAELDLVLQELAPLVGVQLQKVVQPDSHTVCLRLMRSWILLGVKPGFCRVHLLSGRPGSRPGDAPAFCMLLRKVLLNGRLVQIRRQEGDRVVSLEFGAGSLVVELWDRRANVMLLDDKGIILGTLRPPRPGLEQAQPYQPPPPPPVRAQVKPGEIGEGRRGSAEIESYYRDLALAEQRAALGRQVGRALKKARRRERQVAGDLARCQEAERYRKWADLLMAQQSTRQRGRDSLVLPDLFDPEAGPVTIALDPKLDLMGNAQRYYRKQRKLTAGADHIQPRLEAAQELVMALQELRDELGQSQGPLPEDLTDRVAAACPERQGQQRPGHGSGPAPRLPYRRFRSSAGLEILVGRGARDNHQLTFKVARGRDLWLHTRDLPGCHGVVRLDGGTALDHETLLDAATLVAHFSKVKAGQTVEITHTLRKNVRPVAGAPGKVYVSEGRTLRLVVDPERLAGVLSRG